MLEVTHHFELRTTLRIRCLQNGVQTATPRIAVCSFGIEKAGDEAVGWYAHVCVAMFFSGHTPAQDNMGMAPDSLILFIAL